MKEATPKRETTLKGLQDAIRAELTLFGIPDSESTPLTSWNDLKKVIEKFEELGKGPEARNFIAHMSRRIPVDPEMQDEGLYYNQIAYYELRNGLEALSIGHGLRVDYSRKTR